MHTICRVWPANEFFVMLFSFPHILFLSNHILLSMSIVISRLEITVPRHLVLALSITQHHLWWTCCQFQFGLYNYCFFCNLCIQTFFFFCNFLHLLFFSQGDCQYRSCLSEDYVSAWFNTWRSPTYHIYIYIYIYIYSRGRSRVNRRCWNPWEVAKKKYGSKQLKEKN